MRRHVRALPFLALFAVPLSLSGGACNGPDEPLHRAAKVYSVTQPIVGGQLETGLDATMAMMVLQGEGYAGPICTGTMIAKAGDYGYVLTAAHCGNIDAVFQTDDREDCFNDFDGPTCRVYEVESSQIHPDYPGAACQTNNPPDECAWDFQMLRVFGVDGDTPTVPAATDDGIDYDDPITLAGFGTYNAGNSLADPDGRKRSGTNTISDFQALWISYSQSYQPGNAGVCFGDSGGPTYGMVGGQMQVIGVNQSVSSDNCDDYGYSGRVQAVSGFIAEFQGEDPPPLTCSQCFDLEVRSPGGDCYDEVLACLGGGNADCQALNDCVAECATTSCYNGCLADHPSSVDTFNAIYTCFCATCSTECVDDPSCDDGSTSTNQAGPGVTVGVTTGPSTAAATTGAGAGGPGTGGTDDVDEDDDDDDDDGDDGDEAGDDDGSSASEDDGCSVGAPGAPIGNGALALGLAGLALAAASRRRRS